MALIMSKDLRLKPCPFCGGEASIVKNSGCSSLNGMPYDSLIQCLKCEISQNGWAPENQVIEEWNKRVELKINRYLPLYFK